MFASRKFAGNTEALMDFPLEFTHHAENQRDPKETGAGRKLVLMVFLGSPQ
jgi:hypothetical protein